jgi:hypothetical protein
MAGAKHADVLVFVHDGAFRAAGEKRRARTGKGPVRRTFGAVDEARSGRKLLDFGPDNFGFRQQN